MIDAKNVKVMYIINETSTNKNIYRIKDTESGRMTDTTIDIVNKFGLDCSKAETITINSLENFSGSFRRGINDLDTWCRLHNRLDILADYNAANNEISADSIARGSIQKVNWACNKCGNKWSTHVKSRTTNKTECPKCRIDSGKYKVRTQENLFVNKARGLVMEYLIKEIQLDEGIDIHTLYASDRRTFNWKCSKCNRVYSNCIQNKIKGQKCPYCSKAGTSVPEQVIYLAIKRHYSDTQYRYKIAGYEADIYIPSINTIIDYRGMYYHKDREYIDDLKERLFKENGFNQIIILASNSYSNKENNQYIFFDGKSFAWLINTIYNKLKIKGEVNKETANKVVNKAIANRSTDKVINCVAETNPELLEIWDYEANKDSGITLYSVTKGTKYKAWFKCNKCSNSYYAFIRKQVIGQRCPVCNGSKVIAGVNDTATTDPYVLSVWDFDRNNEIGVSPYSIKSGSLKRIFIKCRYCSLSSDYQLRDIINRKNTIKCNACKHKFFEE